MAVIESKGNGYALFNGVKLPSSPEYDESEFPYKLVASMSEGSSVRILAVSTIPYAWDDGRLIFDKHSRCYWRKTTKSEDWVMVKSDEEADAGEVTWIPVWSNYDIINTTDNTTYLAASEPISLDGMNVIEWDGDTTGLAQFGTAPIYRVASVTNVDVTKGTVAVRITAHTAISQHTWSDSGEYYNVATARYVAKESETYPNVGIYIPKFTNGRVALFAYYPIESSDSPSDSDGEKTNIHFNNKDYSVNNSSLAPHSADLKSHLSTVMNGTGAVINLGGVTYNVDATKLAAARNAFIQHLGTIAGSGHKVVIGGVEYGIDAGKVAGAVSEIEAVLGGAISGGGEGSENILILDESSLDDGVLG